jgi:NAD(P)H dehydrogenase (quinone)
MNQTKQREEKSMYTVMGVTGQVGAVVADTLLSQGQQVRVIVRNPEKAVTWRERGAEVAIANFDDVDALQSAFRGVKGAFVMIPPNFAPAPGFPESRAFIAAIREALAAAKPGRVVALSTIGAQHASGTGLLESLNILEVELGALPIPIAFLRAGWFMENSRWDVPSAQQKGQISSYLQPLDKEFSLVATADIGRTGAETLLQDWTGNRFIEVAGPKQYSPRELAATFSKILNRPVEAVAVPRETWAETFVSQGTPADRTAYRIDMLDGFNSGHISFGVTGTEHVTGTVSLEEVLKSLVV